MCFSCDDRRLPPFHAPSSGSWLVSVWRPLLGVIRFFRRHIPPCTSVQVAARAISFLEQCMFVACFRFPPFSVEIRFVRKHHIAKHRSRCSQLDIVSGSTCLTNSFQLRQPSFAAVPCTLLWLLSCFGLAPCSGRDTIFQETYHRAAAFN